MTGDGLGLQCRTDEWTVRSVALGGLVSLAVGIGVGRFVYTPIIPAMIASLGLSKFTAGLIASANFGGYLSGALIASSSVLPGTRRGWLIAGLIASSTTTLAMGGVSSLLAFIALRFFGGIASALVFVFTTALLLDYRTGRGTAASSAVVFSGVGVGIAVSAAMVSLLSASGQDWRGLWIASGVLSALGGVAAAYLIPAEPNAKRVQIISQSRHLDRRLVFLTAAYGLFGFGYVITATFLAVQAGSLPGLRGIQLVVWIVFGLAASPSVIFWNWCARSTGITRAFAIAALIEAGSILAGIYFPTVFGVIIASVGVGGTFMGLTTLGLVRGRELAQGDMRRIVAVMTSAFGFGQIIGPSFAGYLFNHLGSLAVPSTAAAITLTLAAILVSVA